MSKELFNFHVDEERKMITINFRGTPEKGEVNDFHAQYMSHIAPLPTKEYLLLLNAREMDMPEPHRLVEMQISFALYRQSGFKTIGFMFRDDSYVTQLRKIFIFSGIAEATDISFITADEKEAFIENHLKDLEQ